MGDALYDEDFYLWTQDQADKLRAMRGDNRLDVENLAEEVADLGRSELGKVRSHLRQLLIHLLEAAWASDEGPQRGWRMEIVLHQQEATETVTPAMRNALDLDAVWGKAARAANAKLADHGDPPLPEGASCPFALDELLSDDFDPEAARERVATTLADAARAR